MVRMEYCLFVGSGEGTLEESIFFFFKFFHLQLLANCYCSLKIPKRSQVGHRITEENKSKAVT